MNVHQTPLIVNYNVWHPCWLLFNVRKRDFQVKGKVWAKVTKFRSSFWLRILGRERVRQGRMGAGVSLRPSSIGKLESHIDVRL